MPLRWRKQIGLIAKSKVKGDYRMVNDQNAPNKPRWLLGVCDGFNCSWVGVFQSAKKARKIANMIEEYRIR